MLAKCLRNVQMLQIFKKLCWFATFCPNQTQHLPVKPVLVQNQGQTHPHKCEQTSEKAFGTLLPFHCKKQKLILFIVFFTYLVDCILWNKYFLFILLVLLTRKTTFSKSFAKCCFVMTSPMSKWQHFWPVTKKFYDMSTTCLVSPVVLASLHHSWNMNWHDNVQPICWRLQNFYGHWCHNVEYALRNGGFRSRRTIVWDCVERIWWKLIYSLVS